MFIKCSSNVHPLTYWSNRLLAMLRCRRLLHLPRLWESRAKATVGTTLDFDLWNLWDDLIILMILMLREHMFNRNLCKDFLVLWRKWTVRFWTKVKCFPAQVYLQPTNIPTPFNCFLIGGDSPKDMLMQRSPGSCGCLWNDKSARNGCVHG